MCHVRMVHFSGVYAWLKEPLSPYAQEDMRQTDLIQKAWADSGKVYGYRKLHDDLLDQGEICSEYRVARLANLAGISAQIGYNATLAGTGASPLLLLTTRWTDSSKLKRQMSFGSLISLASKRTKVGHIWQWLLICSQGALWAGPLLADCSAIACRAAHAITHDDRSRSSSPACSNVAAQTKDQGGDPFRSRFSVHQQGVAVVSWKTQSCCQPLMVCW